MLFIGRSYPEVSPMSLLSAELVDSVQRGSRDAHLYSSRCGKRGDLLFWLESGSRLFWCVFLWPFPEKGAEMKRTGAQRAV